MGNVTWGLGEHWLLLVPSPETLVCYFTTRARCGIVFWFCFVARRLFGSVHRRRFSFHVCVCLKVSFLHFIRPFFPLLHRSVSIGLLHRRFCLRNVFFASVMIDETRVCLFVIVLLLVLCSFFFFLISSVHSVLRNPFLPSQGFCGVCRRGYWFRVVC